MGRRARPNPSFSDLPEDVQVYLDVAMEAGLNFDRLAQAIDRGDKYLGQKAVCLRAELWFWQRDLTWSYPELTKHQEEAWDDVVWALQEWLAVNTPFDPEGHSPYSTDAITAILDAYVGNGYANDEVGNDINGDGATIFYVEAGNELFGIDDLRQSGLEGDAAELNWVDREALGTCLGAILRWDSQGFQQGTLYFERADLDTVWTNLIADYAIPAPTVRMSNTDDDEDFVLLIVDGEGAEEWARNDYTIHGARWEIHRGDNFASAIVPNESNLNETLEAAGYTVDDSEWSPPE